MIVNESLMSIAERAAMADMYEHFANIDDEGAMFMDECIYESVPDSETDIQLKEEYQEFFNSRYDLYRNMLGFKD